MKKEDKDFKNIIVRYFILILIAIPGFGLLYALFLPLTKFPVFFFLNLFYDTVIVNNSIFVGQKSVEIIGACIAGSAYYLLLILNLATPNIEFKKRIKIILTGFLIFLSINIIRIFILSIMYFNNSPSFDLVHKLLWYVGGTVFVILIWFFQVKIFKIDAIPFYTDLKKIYKKSLLNR
jgi:exosortase/archaeosortase family protein